MQIVPFPCYMYTVIDHVIQETARVSVAICTFPYSGTDLMTYKDAPAIVPMTNLLSVFLSKNALHSLLTMNALFPKRTKILYNGGVPKNST